MRRINQRAGDGTFSLVFRADDGQGSGPVALKFHYGGALVGDDQYRRECFYRESRILEQMAGQRDLLPLVEPLNEFALELVDSATNLRITHRMPYIATGLARANVNDYIYQRRTTPLTNLTYFSAMCRGVQRLHRSAICHRDIRPDNFFLMELGGLCLGDFGTARLFDGSEPALRDSYYGWRGDRRYAAPEMFAAIEDDDLFYCGDMFSLGAVLFEMFTKHNLTTIVFGDRWHLDLLTHLSNVQRDRRRELFGPLATSLAQRTPLPDIDAFGDPVPERIRGRLNRLYKGLAHLDYRQRTGDFAQVFHEVEKCITTLTQESEYRRRVELQKKWMERRKHRRQENEEKKDSQDYPVVRRGVPACGGEPQ